MLTFLLIFLCVMAQNLVQGADNNVLVYSQTAGYRHASIPAAQSFLKTIPSINCTFSESPSSFSLSNLLNYDAIVFLHNSDDILDDQSVKNLFTYLTTGGNLVGIHSATAALFNVSFYGKALGAFFDYHPDLQPATFTPLNSSTSSNSLPSLSSVPLRWNFSEEVYYFRSNPRDNNVQVLLTVDPTSYIDTTANHTVAQEDAIQGTPHPIAWLRDQTEEGLNIKDEGGIEGNMRGRMWYTSLGHEISTWQDPAFQSHISDGILWVLNSTTRASSSPSSTTSDGSTTPTTTESANSSAFNSHQTVVHSVSVLFAIVLSVLYLQN